MLGLTESNVQKFWVQKILGLKNFESENILGPKKNFNLKNIWSKKLLVQKIFKVQKNSRSKQLGVPKNLSLNRLNSKSKKKLGRKIFSLLS